MSEKRSVPYRFAGLALAVFALAPPASAAYSRLGDDVVPTAQSVALVLDPAQSDYRGSVAIDLEVRRPTDVVRFHARGQELSEIVLTGADGKAVATVLSRDADIASLQAASALAPGEYRLSLAFSQKFNTRSVALYRAEFEGHPYLFTQLEATEAREAFPCWDEPAFKIPWSITLTVPADLVALSNMPVRGESTAAGRRELIFAPTPPLPSYLVALAVGPLESVPVAGTSIPTRIVTAKGQSGLAAVAARETPAILAALERYFGRPYPFAKLDLIAVPEFAYGAMENPGLIVFADGILLADTARVSPAALRLLVDITAHEIAHMWFGDLVTMQWWDDFWLNESFADWMALKVTEELHPELEGALQAMRSTQDALLADALPANLPIRPAGETTPDQAMQHVGAVYDKGNAVLSMIEGWIGAPAFRRGVLDYLEAHAWGNATGPDLWNALSKAAGKDVGGVLAGFIDQPAAPLVRIETLGAGRIRVTQNRYARAGEQLPPLAWNVPLRMRYRDDSGVRSWSGLLPAAAGTGPKDPPFEIDLPHSGAIRWLLPNADAAGYYRWTLPPAELAPLMASAAGDLTPLERIGLIGNLRSQLEAATLSGDRYLSLLPVLATDREPAVAGAAAAALRAAGDDLVPDGAREAYAAFLRRRFGPRIAELGWRPAPDERESVKLLRPAVLRLVGDLGGDRALRAEARRLVDAALAAPSSAAGTAALDESIADVAFQLAAIDGDRALWETYRGRFEGASTPGDRGRYLRALGSFGAPQLADTTLAYVLTDAVRPPEKMRLAGSVSGAHHEDRTFTWMTQHYDALAPRLPPFMLSFMPYFGGGCSAERWRQTEVFFAEPTHRVPGIEQQLAQLAEEVAGCVRLRDREGAAVSRWLAAAERGK